MKRKMAALLLVLGGSVLLGRAVYLHAKAEVAGVLIRRAWEKTVASGRVQRPWSWADTHPVARLRIPRLGYDEIVLEGATPRTLAFGPAHLLSGARLGEPGNVQLAGHRTSWFRSLEGIARGDVIELEWVDARRGLRRRSYRVETIEVVGPHDAAMLAATADDALTLITCYPFGRRPDSPQRFLVRAAPVREYRAEPRKPELNATRQEDGREAALLLP